ncbi:MAG: ribonuclease HII [Nanoarchaeota archaeon]|nr:ribonuclease HII [Nanoarchaeota archaeon]
MLTLGIDDAGRGPIIGPMILAGVLVTSDQEKILKKNDVRDSKTVLHPARIKLSVLIKQNSLANHITITHPAEIDSSLQEGTNLNTLEAMKAAKIINEINTGKYRKEELKVIIDCPSVNIDAWSKTLSRFIHHPDNLRIICEHKADANHISVSAASILAKVTREEEVEKIKKKYLDYGDVGSGYPSDPATKDFLKKHGIRLKNEDIFRKTWKTWRELFPNAGKGQATLEGFRK